MTFLTNHTSPVTATNAPLPTTASVKPLAPKAVPPTAAIMSEPVPDVAAQVGLSSAVIPKSRPIVGDPAPQQGDFGELELGIERKPVVSKAVAVPSAARPASPAKMASSPAKSAAPRPAAVFDADSIFCKCGTSSHAWLADLF